MTSTENASTLPCAAPCSESLRREALTTATGLAALVGDWHTLTEERTPVEQFAWSEACSETLARRDRLRVITVCRGEDAVAIAPLFVRRGLSLGRLEMLGVSLLGEPMDLVATDAESLEHLCDALVRARRPLLLGRLPESSPVIAALKKSL